MKFYNVHHHHFYTGTQAR